MWSSLPFLHLDVIKYCLSFPQAPDLHREILKHGLDQQIVGVGPSAATSSSSAKVILIIMFLFILSAHSLPDFLSYYCGLCCHVLLNWFPFFALSTLAFGTVKDKMLVFISSLFSVDLHLNLFSASVKQHHMLDELRIYCGYLEDMHLRIHA